MVISTNWKTKIFYLDQTPLTNFIAQVCVVLVCCKYINIAQTLVPSLNATDRILVLKFDVIVGIKVLLHTFVS